jgi:hypothetical protein
MAFNRANLSTTAAGADIFVITGANSPFTNLGTLTTSGDLASAIYGTASGISITNRGSLFTTGNGSPGIEIGELFGSHYDNSSVTNYGSISTGGSLVDDGTNLEFSDGIDLYGSNNRALNFGSIVVTNADPDFAVYGIYSIGLGSTLTNYGKIDSTGGGMGIDGIDGTETGNTVLNFGQIHVTGDDRDGITLNTADNVVKNYGIITIDGIVSFGIALRGDGNHGENYGTVLATGEGDRGVILEGEETKFDNYGMVRTTGLDSVGARFSGFEPAGTDGGTITNYGKIISSAWAVKGALADDHFVNHGTLVGDAYMGAGDDTYVAGAGGSLSGALTLADGDDLIVLEKGGGKLRVTDFTAGVSTDDVIDLSAFHFHSFDEVMSHASQSDTDVILSLGGNDVITLQNVTLGTLSSDDFSLGSLASATAIPMSEQVFPAPLANLFETHGHHFDLHGML